MGGDVVWNGLGAIFVIAASTLSGVAQAQNFPIRPVTLIVPWVPGGPTDVAMRTIAAATEKYLGQAIIIEYRPGAAGTVGPIEMASTAKPDGYTIAQISENVLAAPFMRDMTFDPIQDLTYIIRLSGYTFGVVAKNDAPWTTFQALMAEAKAKPGTIT
jgi:tripartite-type tricarboxylate transporter receptor subunit TctC